MDWAQAALWVVASLFPNGRAPIEAGGQASAEACRSCHAAEYEDWQQSRHRVAWTNSLFQRDYQRTRRAWCKNCHMPLSAQHTAGERSALAEEGVNCAACHVRGGRILAGRKDRGSPHDTQIVTGFGGATYCGGCHEFRFPVLDGHGRFVRNTDEPMQATVSQHQESGGRGCLACHRAGPGGHQFPGSHSETLLKSALTFRLCTVGSAVTVAVQNTGAGHNVPTGDVHRHIVGRIWRAGAPERLREWFIGRRFALTEGGAKRTTWDSTLPPQATRRWRVDTGVLGGTPREAVTVEFSYLYGSQEFPRRAGTDPAKRVLFRWRGGLSSLPSCKDLRRAGEVPRQSDDSFVDP